MVTFIVYDNVKGPTLNIVELGLFPDIYTMQFHSLNASLSSPFGEKKGNENTC